jgi:hypothetical protein
MATIQHIFIFSLEKSMIYKTIKEKPMIQDSLREIYAIQIIN